MGGVVAKLVFRPPAHPTYSDVDGKMLFIRKKQGNKRGEIMEEELIYLDTATGNRIPALFMQQPDAKYTILYSHANMEDLGLTARFCSEMSEYLHVNVFLYDYTGYGLSTGKPSEKNVYADVNAAYDYLTKVLNIKPDKIVIMGRSVGSGPSTEIASKKQVGGLVLVCAITSCVRVMKKVPTTPNYDMFPNIDKIHRVRCHVLVVHGKKDSTVPIDHGVQLSRKARCSAPPLWLENANHNDLETDYKMVLLDRYKEFLEHLENELTETTEDKLDAIKLSECIPMEVTPVQAEKYVALFVQLKTGVLCLSAFEAEDRLHLVFESHNANNSALLQMNENVTLIIAHRFMLSIQKMIGDRDESVDISTDVVCDYGVALPQQEDQEDQEVGSWVQVTMNNCSEGLIYGTWIASQLMCWTLSGQEAFAGLGTLDGACSGQLNFQSEWAHVSSDCKLVVRRMLMLDGRRRMKVKEAVNHRLFTETAVFCDENREKEIVYEGTEAVQKVVDDYRRQLDSKFTSMKFVEEDDNIPLPLAEMTERTRAHAVVLDLTDMEHRFIASAKASRSSKRIGQLQAESLPQRKNSVRSLLSHQS